MSGKNVLRIKNKRTRSKSKKRRTKIPPEPPIRRFDLIVFDIDSTLFDSIDKEDGKVSTKADHKLTHGGEYFKMYARPHLTSFMQFCQKYFKRIALWTHADRLWLKKFIENVLPDGVELLFKYHSSHGEEKSISKKGEESKTVRLKPLRKIYKEFPQFNSDNTIIIEDTEENCLENLKNCIIVPEFSIIKHEKESPDLVLPLLARYLLKLQTGEVKNIERKGWYQKELRDFHKKEDAKRKKIEVGKIKRKSTRRKSHKKK